jgi:hypothetical protein
MMLVTFAEEQHFAMTRRRLYALLKVGMCDCVLRRVMSERLTPRSIGEEGSLSYENDGRIEWNEGVQPLTDCI